MQGLTTVTNSFLFQFAVFFHQKYLWFAWEANQWPPIGRWHGAETGLMCYFRNFRDTRQSPFNNKWRKTWKCACKKNYTSYNDSWLQKTHRIELWVTRLDICKGILCSNIQVMTKKIMDLPPCQGQELELGRGWNSPLRIWPQTGFGAVETNPRWFSEVRAERRKWRQFRKYQGLKNHHDFWIVIVYIRGAPNFAEFPWQ